MYPSKLLPIQIFALMVVNDFGFTVRLTVLTLSQPLAATNVFTKIPETVYPSKLWPWQIIGFNVVKDFGFTVRLSVRILSHPLAATKVFK